VENIIKNGCEKFHPNLMHGFWVLYFFSFIPFLQSCCSTLVHAFFGGWRYPREWKWQWHLFGLLLVFVYIVVFLLIYLFISSLLIITNYLNCVLCIQIRNNVMTFRVQSCMHALWKLCIRKCVYVCYNH